MPIQQQEATLILRLLTAVNQLHLKAFEAKSQQSLNFLMLNDTVQVVRYDRAVLWKLDGGSAKVIGISGQTSINSSGELIKSWTLLINDLITNQKPQQLSQDSFAEQKELWKTLIEEAPLKPSVVWIPFVHDDKTVICLWLERWNNAKWQVGEMEILHNLMKAYGHAWLRFKSNSQLQAFGFFDRFRKRTLYGVGIGLLLSLLLLIRIPLRVVAPCEIVPKDPYLVTAPIEGTIAEVVVQPGELVKKGDLLFEYDKRVAMEKLEVAKKQLEITRSEVARATTLSFKDPRSATELSILKLKEEKENINLSLANYYVSQLTAKARVGGVVIIDDPDVWRGKPVQVGEKILVISDPQKTKIRMWIPESDNIDFDFNEPIHIVLNIDPSRSRLAKLEYIANYVTLSEKQVPSFIAEADWIESSDDIKLGLKGTAVLYGENVSLLYVITRRPLKYLRNLIGW